MRRDKAYQTELADAYICLFVFTHPNLAVPIRMTDAGEDVVVGVDTYAHVPLKIALPDMTDESPPAGRLVLDNVSRDLIAEIRTFNTPLACELRVVLASAPATVELGPFDFEVRNVQWGALTLTADLVHEPILGVAVPCDTFNAAQFPGMGR
jgi:hypothetical protein